MGMAASDTKQEEKRGYFDIVRDSARALAQGITFGTADELEAFVRSYIDSDKSYSELRDEIREDINQFRQNSPYAAYGLEILGSVPSGVAGVGKTLAGTAVRSAVMGGAYGAGASEGDIVDRAKGAAIGGAISGAAGPLVQKIIPSPKSVSDGAKELMSKGVNLTPGQATKGTLVGNTVNALEQGSTSLPLVGTMVKGALNRSTESFNRAVINDALKSINKLFQKI